MEKLKRIKEELWVEFINEVSKDPNAKIFHEVSEGPAPQVIIFEGIAIIRELNNERKYDGTVMKIAGYDKKDNSILEKYHRFMEEV